MGRLDEKSPAVQLLRKTFGPKEIKPSDEPRDVHRSDPVFQYQNLDAFRTKLNKLKRDYYGSESK